MSANPRRVLADVTLYWPPGNTAFPLHIRRGSQVSSMNSPDDSGGLRPIHAACDNGKITVQLTCN
jgi:hypothetical protein